MSKSQAARKFGDGLLVLIGRVKDLRGEYVATVQDITWRLAISRWNCSDRRCAPCNVLGNMPVYKTTAEVFSTFQEKIARQQRQERNTAARKRSSWALGATI